ASQTILELWPSSSLEEVQTIIRAVYKQVLGN
nr:CpeD=C-phycoerythrin-associated rod-linker polypeptide [Calothrix sp., PCC 7601, phycobilisomes, Peptide Partial, 31 aa] [Calothrix]